MRPRKIVKWIVYPPNYKPGDGFWKYNHIKDAWNKACSVGLYSELWRSVEITRRDGSSSSYIEPAFEVIEKGDGKYKTLELYESV